MTTKAHRYHDISVGHRVVGHESKCRHLHGHNYRVHFTVEAPQLDTVGRVLDFSVIKSHLCMWLEDNWDHKFLAWEHDPVMREVERMLESDACESLETCDTMVQSVIFVPFNPTAENMAKHLVLHVGPRQLTGTGCTLTEVMIEETRKCSCSYIRERE